MQGGYTPGVRAGEWAVCGTRAEVLAGRFVENRGGGSKANLNCLYGR